MPEEVLTETQKQEAINNTFAASLGKADNPLAQYSNPNEQFKTQPFFQTEEEQPELNADGTVKEKVIEGAEVKPELNTDGTPKIPEVKPDLAEEKPVVEQIPEDQFVSLLNESINDPDFSFSSIADIKSILQENKTYKANQSQLQGYTQEERARIEVGREFGDFGLYDRVIGIDIAKVSPKEALRQVYFLENIGKNTQFLEKAFERDYAKTYSVADEDDTEEKEFSRMLLENNGQQAIKTIVEMQEDLKKRGQVSGGANTEEAEKAKKQEDDRWLAAVDNVISKNDRVIYQLEDGLDINIVMDAKDKPEIKNHMDSPIQFLKSLITDKDGKYDHEALFDFVMWNKYRKNILDEAKKAGSASREEKILKEKKNSAPTTPAGSVTTKPNLSERMVEVLRSGM